MKLPVLSGMEVIKRLQKLGYDAVRQTGSHVRMKHISDNTKEPITIPMHSTIGRGLLRKILRQADILPEDFEKLL